MLRQRLSWVKLRRGRGAYAGARGSRMRTALKFRLFRFGTAWLMAAVLAGCAAMAPSGRTEMQLEDKVAFAKAHTFTIKTEANPITTSSAEEDAKVRAAIERKIRDMLQSKGYQYASTGADLEVSYHGIVTGRHLGSDSLPVPAAYTPVGPGDPFSAYEQMGGGTESGTEATGMLLILVVDARSNAAVWQGTTTGTGTNPASAVGAAERATDRLLREVPKSGQ
jgi:hypothetical protein